MSPGHTIKYEPWRYRALVDAMEHIADLIAFAMTAMVGADTCADPQRLRQACAELSPDDYSDASQDHVVKLARHEKKSGYPRTMAQLLVATWTALEDAVRTLAFDYLANDRSLWTHSRISGMKMMIGEYEMLDDEGRTWYVLDELDKGAKLGSGAKRFRELLNVIGIGVALPDEIPRKLHEMGQLRHVLVHKRGRVDAHFGRECPHLLSRFPMGAQISLTFEDAQAYSDTAYDFLGAVADHVLDDMKLSIEQAKTIIQQSVGDGPP